MKKIILMLAISGFEFCSTSTWAFNFSVSNASIDALGGDSYRLRVLVDYNLDLKTMPDGTFCPEAFNAFSLGDLLGMNQDSFSPWSDKAGEWVWYADGWWHSWHLGPAPLNLPGYEFGYDFHYAGDLTQPFTLQYAAQATTWWFDSERGAYGYNVQTISGTTYATLGPQTSPYAAVPEPTTLCLLGLALVGAGVHLRLRRK